MKTSDTPKVPMKIANKYMFTVLASAALLLGSFQNTHATLIAAEDFSYANGSLSNPSNNGGEGWSGAWTGSSVPLVLSSANLSYTAIGYDIIQSTTGRVNSVESSGGGVSRRSLENPIAGTEEGTEVWFSILIQTTGPDVGGNEGRAGMYFNVSTDDRGSAAGGFLLVGTGFRRLSDGTLTPTGKTLSLNTTHLVVGHINLLEEGSSSVSLWLDPSDVSSVESLGDADVIYTANFGGTITNVGIEAYGQGTLAVIGMADALRVGTTLNSVVAIPEPTTIVLLVSTGFILFVSRFRRVGTVKH